MVIEYNANMKIILYDSREIEIVENIDNLKKWLFYFKNITELAELINTNPNLAKKLKELI